MKPTCLDLFSGAGGCTKGYQDAGFYVVGIDNRSQPRYCGDDFLQADALEVLRTLTGGGCIIGQSGRVYYLADFDLIAASPPCHHYSTGTKHRKNAGIVYPDLLPKTQELLRQSGKPYVIENVSGARGLMNAPILLCGGMFGLGVTRHRYFETSHFFLSPGHNCNGDSVDRDLVSVTRHGPPVRWYRKNPGKSFSIKVWHEAMEIDWMTRSELTQAIPPAYTRFIGQQMLELIREATQ